MSESALKKMRYFDHDHGEDEDAMGNSKKCSQCEKSPVGKFDVVQLHPIYPAYTKVHYMCVECVERVQSSKTLVDIHVSDDDKE